MKNKNAGFTLIEILIALVILSVALMAMIKSTSQNIKDTVYIQNKTIATWVGTQVINEIRTGLLKMSLGSESLKDETEMLGRKWDWKASMTTTPNPHIKKVTVKVYLQSNSAKLADLESYLYVP